MSATGHGGLTQISVTLSAAGVAGSKYTFTHNVGRALQVATATDTTGNPIQGVSVLQSSLNACVIQNLTATAQTVVVNLQWEELSTKLNVVTTADSRMTAGTATITNLTIYVATTGSDAVGDGTQSKPFATIQKALDTLPNVVPGLVTIEVGAGHFAPPVRYPSAANLQIIGDRSAPVYAGTPTFAAVAARAATRRANIGAYSFVVTTNSHWIERTDYPEMSVCAISGSVTPNVDVASQIDQLLGAVPVRVHAFRTYIDIPEDTTNYYEGTLEVPFGVVFIGFYFSETQAGYVDFVGAGSVVACTTTDTAYFKVRQNTHLWGVTAAARVVVVDFGNLSGYFGSVEVQRGGSAALDGVVAAPSNLYPGVQLDVGGVLQLSSTDFTGAYAHACLSVLGGTVYQNGDIRVVATQKNRFLALDGGRWARASGTVSGSIAGVPVVLTNGAHATGLEAACAGNLTNGSTPGNDITVGGNATNTFASLPATDLAAGSPQLCRAT